MSRKSSFVVWAIVLLLGLVGQTIAVNASLPVNDHRSLGAVRSTIGRGDLLTKPHGWLQFEEVCAFGSSFAATLDRAKRSRIRVIGRDFWDGSGNLSQQALPTALGLECVPYSVGFD